MIDKQKAILLISNIQKEFIPTLIEGQKLIDSCCWLIELSKKLDIPVINLYHKKLGEKVSSIYKCGYDLIDYETVYFSCAKNEDIVKKIEELNKSQVILCGSETHVSIFQSAIDLQLLDKQVFVILDAVSSRNTVDHETAIKRLSQKGIEVITKEMLFFESIRQSEFSEYMDLSLKFLDNRYIRD